MDWKTQEGITGIVANLRRTVKTFGCLPSATKSNIKNNLDAIDTDMQAFFWETVVDSKKYFAPDSNGYQILTDELKELID
ncbi:MAG: hypothetical protein CVU90_12105 [Firmicutes bacterium HGW-Firmicutes-15]|nr:MAG: hypothetical protein CVU90_12105 [Firmicutes bacterium HGW-Firmicutes-15]